MTTHCRLSHKSVIEVMDFGELFVSDFLPTRETSAAKGRLRLGLGQESGLLQIIETIDPESMYRNYWYRSGTNETMTRQLREIVTAVQNWAPLRRGDIVLDIGCNDGTLLKAYPAHLAITKVGIDPAINLAATAKEVCDLHAASFFTNDSFFSLTNGRKAKVITSIAMFYDLEDPHAFVEDIRQSLTDDGIWVIQLSYTPLMFSQNAFDNICHEHIEYYTLESLTYLLEAHGLKIIDVELNDTNSGSFRVVITKAEHKMRNANLFLRDVGECRLKSLSMYEKTLRLCEPETYIIFKKRVDALRNQTVETLRSLKKKGKRIFGYGASTKGNTLLQYYGLDTGVIEAIAERQKQKVGTLTAGSWIPIVSEEEMRKAKPDYLFVLPWHFINEFLELESEFVNRGGKFIVPLPELQIVG
jgi:SAM-dependent methyltransferase